MRGSPGRGRRPLLQVASFGRGAASVPCAPGSGSRVARTRVVPRASLQPRLERTQAVASAVRPSARLSLEVYRPSVSPSSSFPVCLCWGGGPRVRRFWKREGGFECSAYCTWMRGTAGIRESTGLASAASVGMAGHGGDLEASRPPVGRRHRPGSGRRVLRAESR